MGPLCSDRVARSGCAPAAVSLAVSSAQGRLQILVSPSEPPVANLEPPGCAWMEKMGCPGARGDGAEADSDRPRPDARSVASGKPGVTGLGHRTVQRPEHSQMRGNPWCTGMSLHRHPHHLPSWEHQGGLSTNMIPLPARPHAGLSALRSQNGHWYCVHIQYVNSFPESCPGACRDHPHKMADRIRFWGVSTTRGGKGGRGGACAACVLARLSGSGLGGPPGTAISLERVAAFLALIGCCCQPAATCRPTGRQASPRCHSRLACLLASGQESLCSRGRRSDECTTRGLIVWGRCCRGQRAPRSIPCSAGPCLGPLRSRDGSPDSQPCDSQASWAIPERVGLDTTSAAFPFVCWTRNPRPWP